MDEIRKAYATLGLHDGAHFADVRGRYKALARRWHPDRYTADPQLQAEAADQMRRVNAAYRTLAHRLEPRQRRPLDEPQSPPAPAARGRLSREEIDAMVEAIGSTGPVDWLFGWVGPIHDILRVVVPVALFLRLMLLLLRGELGAVLRDFNFLLLLALASLVSIVAARRVIERRKLAETRGPPDPAWQRMSVPGQRERAPR